MRAIIECVTVYQRGSSITSPTEKQWIRRCGELAFIFLSTTLLLGHKSIARLGVEKLEDQQFIRYFVVCAARRGSEYIQTLKINK